MSLKDMLLPWYDNHARILPWRQTKDPYAIWVSEIMLQQTRVDTVIAYYERFLAEVPTVKHLAFLPQEKLLKLWQGLGYYRRAINMQKAAQKIVAEHNGIFPQTFEQVKNLPGIGEYTAGAICSIAFNQPVTAVDGNVLRVIARVTGNKQSIDDAANKKLIASQVKQELPINRVGDFNQSLMELGATVCLPNGKPLCAICPLKEICVAQKQNLTEQIPLKAQKKQKPTQNWTVFVLEHQNTFALEQRPQNALLGFLWQFPMVENHASAEQAEQMLKNWGFEVIGCKALPAHKHVFTHLNWQLNAYHIVVANKQERFVWANKQQLHEVYSVPTAFAPYLKAIMQNKI